MVGAGLSLRCFAPALRLALADSDRPSNNDPSLFFRPM